MKNTLATLALLLTACSPTPPLSFAERVAQAEALEKTPAGMAYIKELLLEHEEFISTFAADCYSKSSLQKDTFKLVADIDPQGNIGNVVVQPETAPTRCYAHKIDQVLVNSKRPIGFSEKSFPLFLAVKYNK